MADFDGRPLRFRDDGERRLWAGIVQRLSDASSGAVLGQDIGDIADSWVVEQRKRDGLVEVAGLEGGRPVVYWACAVCSARKGETHMTGCPLEEKPGDVVG